MSILVDFADLFFRRVEDPFPDRDAEAIKSDFIYYLSRLKDINGSYKIRDINKQTEIRGILNDCLESLRAKKAKTYYRECINEYKEYSRTA